MKRIWQSFRYGIAGFMHVARSERNMQFHLLAALGALAMCTLLRVAVMDWALILMAIALVLSAECINTALERLADRTCAEDDPLIRQCKDAAAAGVLVMAVLSLAIGGIVFLPRLLELVGG